MTEDRVSAAIGRLDGLAHQTLAATSVPGMAIAVVYKDQVVYIKGFGVRETGTAAPVDADTVFQLASVSKPVASTVVAALVGKGVVHWDDPIASHDAGFQLYDPWVTRKVTLRDMFAHRSGLPDHAGDALEDIGYGREEILQRLRYQKPASSFRSEYAYTNFGLTEAAVAAARADGESWEDASADMLYKPLGMTATSSRHSDFLAAQNRAHLHVLVDGAWVAEYDRDPDAQSPAGGVSSSVRDMAQWLRLQLGGGAVDGRQIVAADARAETHRPQIVSNPPKDPSTSRAGFYGLGWNVGYDDAGGIRWSHSGAFALGGATAVTLLPAEGLGIVVLTNAAPIGVPETMAFSFLDLVETGSIQRDWLSVVGPAIAAAVAPQYGTTTNYAMPPTQPVPALPDAAYVGLYSNDYVGEIGISAEAGGLVLHLGPARTPYALQHWDRDVFLYQPSGENAGGPSAVTFTIGPDSSPASVVIENLDVDGEGLFTPVATPAAPS